MTAIVMVRRTPVDECVRDLRKSRQIEIRGADTEDYFGIRVAGVGDLDGDSADEFVVASQARESESSLFTPGAVYLYKGAPVRQIRSGLTHDIMTAQTSLRQTTQV